MRRTTRLIAAVVLCALATAVAGPVRAEGAATSRSRTFRPAPAGRPAGSSGGSAGATASREGARVTWRADAVAPLAAPAIPSATLGFDAIPRLGEDWPASPTGALGDSVFVTAVNSSIAVYDRTGVATLGPRPLRPLFPLARGTQVFDPKVVYDQYAERFVVAFLGVNEARQRSSIMLISIPDRSANDLGTWCGAQIAGDQTSRDGRQLPDYPGLGYDRDHVVVTTNQFDADTGAFEGVQLLAMATPRLYDCDRTLAFATFTGARTRNPNGTLAFTVQPATTVGSGNALYLLSFQDGRPNFVVLWRLREGRRGLTLTNTAVRVPAVAIGPYATQGGGSLDRANTWWDPGDLRITNAFADLPDDHVYGAHVIAQELRPDRITGGYLEAAIRWYEVRVRPKLKRSSVSRVGTVGVPEADVGWPAIGTDVAGNVFITYARASAPRGEFLSTWVSRIERGRTADAALLLAGGSARMEANPGPERWGTTAAVSRDPLDPSLVALVNQYALDDGSGTTRDWQQTVQVVHDL